MIFKTVGFISILNEFLKYRHWTQDSFQSAGLPLNAIKNSLN